VRRVAVGLVAAAALVVAGGGGNAAAVSAQEPVSAKLLGSGTLLEGGLVAEVRVLVRCEPDPPLLEALVTGSQDGAVGFGEGFFVDLTCDGQNHVEIARVQTFGEEQFHAGKGYFSAFILLCDEVSGDCFTGQDTRFVNLR